MKLLAIDTATEVCSAALIVDGDVRVRIERAPRAHGRTILPMVADLLAEADLSLRALDALAFGRGPGGFTGLRIAAGVVQGLAGSTDLPVVPVSDLAALAQQALDAAPQARVLACMDARMREIYWGTFAADAAGLAIPLGDEALDSAACVAPDPFEWTGIGSGFAVEHGIGGRFPGIASPEATAALPGAAEIARLGVRDYAAGLAVPAEKAQPVYLRNEVAWRKTGD